MRVAALENANRFELVDRPDPSPGPRDLVLRVTGCGVCGSDLKARPTMADGTVMGHEFCGEVVAAGTEVAADWRAGVHAAVLPVFSCGQCSHCVAGFVAHCAGAALIGLGGAPGGFGELVRVSADLSFPLPESIPPAWGPLVEPFVVGLHTVRLAEIQDGDRVLVIGGGPVGLTTATWARTLGAGSVTVSDPAARRRDAAAFFGASAVVDPHNEELGGPYDVVFECVGKPGLLDAAAAAVEVRGRIVVAGVCAEPDSFIPLVPLLKEITIRFSVYYRPVEFRAVVAAFADGLIDPSPLVTRAVGLGALDEVFDGLMSAPDDLKVVVDPSL